MITKIPNSQLTLSYTLISEEGKSDDEDLSQKEGKSDKKDLSQKKPKRKIRTPMQVVVHDRQLENIEHQVFCELIEVKWKEFGRFWAWFDFFLDLTFIILWTALATIKPDARACYYFPGDIWRVILWIISIGYTVFLIIQELREFWTSKRELQEWKAWKLWILENDMADCHPKWPQEKEWLDNEIEDINKMKASYFHDYWNIFDWFVYILLTACVVLHFIDIIIVPHELCSPGNGTTGNATTEPVKVDDDEIESLASRLHIRVFSITIIFVWVRILKSARAFMTLGPFIAMCYKILADVARFLFLYIVFYIPYTSAFWMMFGGDVEEFETISETLFSLFRMTLVDEYNYEGLKEENPIMCDILVGTYLAISAIVLLNLFIAMLSETFVRIHDNAYSIALMERAQIILCIEDNLPDSWKNYFRKYINEHCNPRKKFYDDDMAFESESKDFKKVTFQIKEQLKALSEQLSITSNDTMNSRAEMNTSKQRINEMSSEKRYEQEIDRINKELGQLKAQLTESTADIKNILSILTKTAKKPKGPTDKPKSYGEGDDDGSFDGKKRQKRRPRPKTEAFTEDYLGSEATSQQRHQPSTSESIEMEDLDGSTEA
ncbi:polycystin-2-like protein 2 [Ptychodera flava]|uniref:polycystin-2-like protein 2 n=1 Tax=Ptychodera flava TaxID=63121 RepID=UPI00396A4D42